MTLQLVSLTDTRSPQAEAFRSLRTNLEFFSLDKPLHSLLVTSAAPGEDKSTTLGNLGVTTAQSGKKVLLVDCDLRRPQLHTLFGLDNAQGISDTLLNPDRPVPIQKTAVPDLMVLTSGPLPPNPADLLASPRMGTLLSKLVEQFDMVLLDAPPVVAATDAALLATKCDGVLLVVGAGQTRREHAERAKELLERVKANVVGAVLTDAIVDSKAYGDYGAK